MTTPTSGVTSSHVPSVSAGAAVNAPSMTPAPHTQDSISAVNGRCSTSLYEMIQNAWGFIRAKVYELINYFFPQLRLGCLDVFPDMLQGVQNPSHNYYQKLSRFATFLTMRRIHLVAYPFDRNLMRSLTSELFAALPLNLAEAIVCKAQQLSTSPVTAEDRIEVANQEQQRSLRATLSHRQLDEAVEFLMRLYPERYFSEQLLIINSDHPFSLRAKAEALKALIDFNLDARFDRFNLHNTMTEEAWQENIRQATEALPDEVTHVLFQKMWENVQPQDGRHAFLENPRSLEARLAIEGTLQTFPNT